MVAVKGEDSGRCSCPGPGSAGRGAGTPTDVRSAGQAMLRPWVPAEPDPRKASSGWDPAVTSLPSSQRSLFRSPSWETWNSLLNSKCICMGPAKRLLEQEEVWWKKASRKRWQVTHYVKHRPCPKGRRIRWAFHGKRTWVRKADSRGGSSAREMQARSLEMCMLPLPVVKWQSFWTNRVCQWRKRSCSLRHCLLKGVVERS